MGIVLLKSLILLALLVSSSFIGYTGTQAYALSSSVAVTSTNTDGKTVIRVTNNQASTSNLNTFQIELKDANFKSYSLDSGWVGEKTAPNAVTFTAVSTIKPGITATFEIKTDKQNPSFSWKATGTNNNELGSGEIGVQSGTENKQTNGTKNKQTNTQNNQETTVRGVLDTSSFRIIPSQPSPGFHVRVLGQSFASSTNLDLFLNNNKIESFSSNGKGNFVITTQIPDSTQSGTANFVLKDKQGNQKTFTTNIKNAPIRGTQAQNKPITLSVEPIYHRGDTKIINGTATPGNTLTITFSDSNGNAITIFTTKAEKDGSYSISNTVPIDRAFGKYTITVSDGNNQVSKQYSIVSIHHLSISSSSTRYEPGQTIIINGTSISNQIVTFSIADPTGHQIFSKPVNVTSDGKIVLLYKLDDSAMKGTYIATASQGDDQVPLYFGVGEDPSAQLTATLDKLNYKNTDKPIVNISGPPSSTLNLVIVDPSSKQKFSDTIPLGPDGLATYSFNLTSYTPGVYSLVLNRANDKVQKTFAVGLTTGSGKITMSAVKDTYKPADSIIIIGTSNPNTIIQLSLTDPTGIVVKSLQTFADKTGHFSSFDFAVPPTAIPGVWRIDATSGINHNSIDITVKSFEQGITIHLDRTPGIYTKGDIVEISGTDAGISTNLIIKILDSNSTQLASLSAISTNRGEYSTDWRVPTTFNPGTYTVQVTYPKGTASVGITID